MIFNTCLYRRYTGVKKVQVFFDRDELQMLVSSYYLSPSKVSPEIDYRTA